MESYPACQVMAGQIDIKSCTQPPCLPKLALPVYDDGICTVTLVTEPGFALEPKYSLNLTGMPPAFFNAIKIRIQIHSCPEGSSNCTSIPSYHESLVYHDDLVWVRGARSNLVVRAASVIRETERIDGHQPNLRTSFFSLSPRLTSSTRTTESLIDYANQGGTNPLACFA